MLKKILYYIKKFKIFLKNREQEIDNNPFFLGLLNAGSPISTSLYIYESTNIKNKMQEYEKFNYAEFDRWIKDNGDLTHRLRYDLNEDSIVFDLGGYKGEWAEKIHQNYNSKIYVFEPVHSFYNKILNQFKLNTNVHVFCYGLGPKDEELEISLTSDSSSIFNTEGEKEKIQMKEFIKFLEEQDIKNIDLIKINIEGGEYDLLEYIIEHNILHMFKNIQVQFHRFIPECVARRNNIREHLSKTHETTYDYEFVWENWKLKE